MDNLPVIQLLQGKQIPECPANFLVAMKVTAQDGTVYAAGYIKEHHPHGVPQEALTFRRISLKIGEQRLVDKIAKANEAYFNGLQTDSAS